MNIEEIVKWVESCRHADGGYSSSPDLDPHMLYTLSAVQVLVSLDRLTPEAAEGSAKFVKAQQLPDGLVALILCLVLILGHSHVGVHYVRTLSMSITFNDTH